MKTTIKRYEERIEELNSKLDFAIMFGDERRAKYLTNQIEALQLAIELRKEVSKE